MAGDAVSAVDVGVGSGGVWCGSCGEAALAVVCVGGGCGAGCVGEGVAAWVVGKGLVGGAVGDGGDGMGPGVAGLGVAVGVGGRRGRAAGDACDSIPGVVGEVLLIRVRA